MKEAALIRKLLGKYNLAAPVPEKDRKRILKSKRKTLKKILTGREQWGFTRGLALRFYDLYRKAGMEVTLAFASRSVAVAAALIIIVLAAPFLLMQEHLFKDPFIAGQMFQQKGFIAAYTGDASITRGEEKTEISVKSAVEKGDRISTEESSGLLFHFETGSLVRVLSNTSLVVEETGSLIRIMLEKGGLISKHDSAKKNIVYEIHTENAVATVKGTRFGVIIKDGITSVIVTEGLVTVRHKSSGEIYTLRQGEACEAGKGITARDMSDAEKLEMEQFDEFDLPVSPDSMSSADLESLNEKLKSHEKKSKAGSGKLTLDEIKTRYGRIDEVTLYNGKIIKGTIISRGAVIKVLTVNGTVTVQTRDIKGTAIIK